MRKEKNQPIQVLNKLDTPTVILISVVRLCVDEKPKTHEHKHVVCSCVLFPGEARQRDLL